MASNNENAPVQANDEKPAQASIYRFSENEAAERGERKEYFASKRLNQACAQAIDQAVRDSYRGDFRYEMKAAVQNAVDQFGEDRVSWVLANTLQLKDYDGRFSSSNKDWASTLGVPEEPGGRSFVADGHPVLVDAFVNRYRERLAQSKSHTEPKASAHAQLMADKNEMMAGKTTKPQHKSKGSVEI